MSGFWRRPIGVYVTAVMLITTAYAGLTDAPRVMRSADATPLLVLGLLEGLYGVISLPTIVGLWSRRPWTASFLWVWALACTGAAGLAAGYYADAARAGAAAGAIVFTLAITSAAAWYAGRWLRHSPSTPPHEPLGANHG